jgi:phage-related protein
VKGVSFLGFHSFRDLHILRTGKEIGSPDAKRYTIDIEGSDGELDLTDFFGETKFLNVQHRFDFESIQPRNEQLSQFTDIKNKIHGKKGRIILDDDPSFFYVGRCFVSPYKDEKGIGRISIECDCEPYKYKLQPTIMSVTINGTQTITLTNGRKRAVPTITTTADMTISFGEGIWTNRAGTFTIPELELAEGENLVTVTGTGNITFTWQEGDL